MKRITIVVLMALGFASCQDTSNNPALRAQQQAQIDSLKNEMVKRHIIDSMNNVAAQRDSATAAEKNALVAVPAANHHAPKRVARNSSYSSSRSWSGNAPERNDEVVTTTETRQRKGWSSKAKGAVIGAGAGAVTGALVDKKKGRGAIIGGLLGAGAGTGVGAIIDGKNR